LGAVRGDPHGGPHMTDTAAEGAVVIVGGTRAIGHELGRHYVTRGQSVILTGQDPASGALAVDGLDGIPTGLTFDLSAPETIRAALADVGPVRPLGPGGHGRDPQH